MFVLFLSHAKRTTQDMQQHRYTYQSGCRSASLSLGVTTYTPGTPPSAGEPGQQARAGPEGAPPCRAAACPQACCSGGRPWARTRCSGTRCASTARRLPAAAWEQTERSAHWVWPRGRGVPRLRCRSRRRSQARLVFVLLLRGQILPVLALGTSHDPVCPGASPGEGGLLVQVPPLARVGRLSAAAGCARPSAHNFVDSSRQAACAWRVCSRGLRSSRGTASSASMCWTPPHCGSGPISQWSCSAKPQGSSAQSCAVGTAPALGQASCHRGESSSNLN